MILLMSHGGDGDDDDEEEDDEGGGVRQTRRGNDDRNNDSSDNDNIDNDSGRGRASSFEQAAPASASTSVLPIANQLQCVDAEPDDSAAVVVDDDDKNNNNKKNNKFYGRDEELLFLERAFNKIVYGSDDGRIELVLLGGYSGVGKSALVSQFVETTLREGNDVEFFHVVGKFQQQHFAAVSDADGGAEAGEENGGCVGSGSGDAIAGGVSSASGGSNNSSDPPFSAIVDAFSQFFDDLMVGEPATMETVRKDIVRALGDDGHVVTSMIPALRGVIGESPPAVPSCSAAACGTAAACGGTAHSDCTEAADASVLFSKESDLQRFTYVFRKFIQSLCTECRPLVFFVDDLHWADAASLDLLYSLVMDPALKNVLLIGAYRSNAVTSRHPLEKLLGLAVGAEKSSGGASAADADGSSRADARRDEHYRANVQTMELCDLPLDTINELIAGYLGGCEPDKTRDLSEALWNKTGGNIFFTLQLVDQLRRKHIVYRCDEGRNSGGGRGGWAWEIDRVREEAEVSDNILDLVGSKLRSLPDDLQRALGVASLTRSTFDFETLEVLMEREGYDVDDLEDTLAVGVAEGVLTNAIGSQVYRFAHDRIQEVARTLLLDSRDLNAMRVRMGRQLIDRSRTLVGEDWMCFVGVDHLNACAGYDCDENVSPAELAQLNLSVAERAIKLAAFVPASFYLRKGRQALLRDRASMWKQNYKLALNLYREGADISICLGDFDLGHSLSNEVLQNAVCLRDKLPTYLSLAKGLGRRDRHMESLQLCRTALGMLGCYPNRCPLAQVLGDFLAVKKALKRLSDFEILLLPRMTDETHLITMELWFEVNLRSYYCGEKILLLISILRQVRMTLKYGLSGRGATAFSAYGYVMVGQFLDIHTGWRMSGLSKKIVEATNDKRGEASALICSVSRDFLVYNLLRSEHAANVVSRHPLQCISSESWQQPPPETLETLRRAYKSARETGDLEMSIFAFGQSNLFLFDAGGVPLSAVRVLCSKLDKQLADYRADAVRMSVESSSRCSRNYIAFAANILVSFFPSLATVGVSYSFPTFHPDQAPYR